MMNIFKKHTYEIICDLKTNLLVQRFAQRHMAKGTVMEVRCHGSLLKDKNLVTIEFDSYEPANVVHQSLKETFRDFDLRFGRKLIFIYQKD